VYRVRMARNSQEVRRSKMMEARMSKRRFTGGKVFNFLGISAGERRGGIQ
jgi:hypothetical protein